MLSSSRIFCSMRYFAVAIVSGDPAMVTMRFLVPGEKVPFFDIYVKDVTLKAKKLIILTLKIYLDFGAAILLDVHD